MTNMYTIFNMIIVIDKKTNPFKIFRLTRQHMKNCILMDRQKCIYICGTFSTALKYA